MKLRQKTILQSIFVILCCLNLACTVNISSVAIPTSIATLVKTAPPMATLQLETPASSQASPTLEPEPSDGTQQAQEPTLSPLPSPTIPGQPEPNPKRSFNQRRRGFGFNSTGLLSEYGQFHY